jgi:hypothetical protein
MKIFSLLAKVLGLRAQQRASVELTTLTPAQMSAVGGGAPHPRWLF